jgi:hypothetical protein
MRASLNAPPLDYMSYAPPARKRRGPGFFRWGFLLGGLLCAGRSFAYLGVSPVFIGEIYLGCAILANRHNWIGRWINGILKLQMLPTAIALHLGWGMFEVVRALLDSKPIYDVLRIFAFNYYPLYVLIGIAVGRDLPIRTSLKFWKTVIWCTIVCIFLNIILQPYELPFTFESPLNSIVPVITLALWPLLQDWKWRWWLTPLLLQPIFLASGHTRAATVGLVAGSAAIMVCSKERAKRWLISISAILIVLFFVGPLIPNFVNPDRAPPLDPVSPLARLVSTVDFDLAVRMFKARGYKLEAEELIDEAGTAVWRKAIWVNAMKKLNTTSLMLIGEGGGASLQDLTPNGEVIYTPHNFTIFAIYYTGWLGLTIFLFFLLSLQFSAQRLRNPHLRTVAMTMIWTCTLSSTAGNFMEAPFGAITFYLFVGVALGMDMLPANSPGHNEPDGDISHSDDPIAKNRSAATAA